MGGDRLRELICRRIGGLAAPAVTNVCPRGSTMQKMSMAVLTKPKRLVQDAKTTKTTCPEGAQKKPDTEKGACKITRNSPRQA